MTLMAGLLRNIYQIIKPQLFGEQRTQDAFFGLIFTTYCDRYDCAASTVSRYFTGERILKYKFLRLYMDPESTIPRCPTPLYLDVNNFFSAMLTWESARAKLRDVLDAFLCDIPASDAARILDMPCYIAPDSTHATVVQLTRAIWYAACQDVYICTGGDV